MRLNNLLAIIYSIHFPLCKPISQLITNKLGSDD